MRVSKTFCFAPWLALLLMLAACDDDDEGRDVGAASADTAPPSAGTGLSFGDVTGSSLTVRWDAASDDRTPQTALAYKLVWARTASELDSLEKVDAIAGAQRVLDYEPSALSRTLTGLDGATRYFFALVVRDEALNKALYPVGSVSTLDGAAPVAGEPLSFTNVAATSVTVIWGAASDGTTPSEGLEYKLVRASDESALDTLDEVRAIEGGPELVQPFTWNVTSVDVSGLSTSTRYVFAVVVRDAQGNQALYPASSITTADVTPPTPGSAITFSGVTASSLTVSWGAATDAATDKLAYKLVRADDASQIDTLEEADAIASVVADFSEGLLSAELTELTSSSAYAFAVVVRDESDNRALYAPATGRTLDTSSPTAGSAISFSQVTATGMTVCWGAG
ncbi:MAG: fibronectin type III domain-containing protein, partial [Polyangiales bacterium]